MRARVTDQGVLVPKQMLPDADEVEIRAENGGLPVLPVQGEDPIFGLGTAPVERGVADAAERLDEYLSGATDA